MLEIELANPANRNKKIELAFYISFVTDALGIALPSQVKYVDGNTHINFDPNGEQSGYDLCLSQRHTLVGSGWQYLLYSVAHELRHAWQTTVAEYIDDFEQYISADTDLTGYLTQRVEIDARAYSTIISEKYLLGHEKTMDRILISLVDEEVDYYLLHSKYDMDRGRILELFVAGVTDDYDPEFWGDTSYLLRIGEVKRELGIDDK